MDLFICHSNKDAAIAKALIDLIRSALNIKAELIRCTSVDGYKLPAGVTTDNQLRTEIFDSKVLIGIVSTHSIQSAYVLFELGARWGIQRSLIPLITNKLGSELLSGPLKNINALNSCISSDLFQLIGDLGNYLNIKPESPSVYEGNIKTLVELSLKETLPSESELNINIETETNREDNFSNAENIIKQYCEKEWADDFSMRLHCIEQQRKAVTELKKLKPTDITEKEFVSIRKKAGIEWPEDFVMRVHAENDQINSLRKLKNI